MSQGKGLDQVSVSEPQFPVTSRLRGMVSRYICQMSSQSIQKGSKASSQGYAAARSSSSALSIGRSALSMPGPGAGDGFFMFN